MPSYKLTYFPIKGLAEPIRFLLAYGNIKYEDHRFDANDWPKLKPTMPFGQVPVLEVDGNKLHQSLAICRFLGKQLKIAGDNEWESAEIDAIADTVNDFRVKLATVIFYEKDEKAKETKLADLQKETIPQYLEKFEAIAKANNGHLACKKLTWADIVFASYAELLSFMAKKDIFEGHPNLKKVETNVLSIPAIKHWVETRPKTEY